MTSRNSRLGSYAPPAVMRTPCAPNAEWGATCSLLRRGDGTSFCFDSVLAGGLGSWRFERDFDWNRTRIDGISRARAWSGLGIFNHNLVKIP